MTKQLSSKKMMIIICTAVIAVVAAVAAFIALRTSGEESYRSVMVYELEGSAVIERADIGTFDAAENLYLESGDRVRVKENSMMRLKLDNDKYITAEENTVFVLTAKGNEQDSETRIDLEQGAVINEIQNPLSEKSTYETATPNSVMAVRGTIYRVELYQDKDGNLVTKVYCFEGAVAFSAVSENGMSAPVIVEAGNEAGVNSADLTVSEVTPINYAVFAPQTIEILKKMNIDTGALSDAEDDANDVSSAEEQGDSSGSGEIGEKDNTANIENTENTGRTGNTNKTNRKSTSSTQKSSSDSVSVSGTKPKASEPAQTTAGTPQTGSGSGSTGNGSTGSGSGDNQSGNEPGKGPEVKPDNPEPPKPVEYTVTFQYNGGTFATQKVKAGEKANPPLLKPAQSGVWDFDFDKAINENTTISWK